MTEKSTHRSFHIPGLMKNSLFIVFNSFLCLVCDHEMSSSAYYLCLYSVWHVEHKDKSWSQESRCTRPSTTKHNKIKYKKKALFWGVSAAEMGRPVAALNFIISLNFSATLLRKM